MFTASFIVIAMIETGRVPFDIVEAESELIAGLMTEAAGIDFALLFLMEYLSVQSLATLATLAVLTMSSLTQLLLVLLMLSMRAFYLG